MDGSVKFVGCEYSTRSTHLLSPIISNDHECENLSSTLDPDVSVDSLSPTAARPSHQVSTSSGTSWYGAVFLIINAALGAGLLNFPQAYDLAGGFIVAILVQAVLLIFIVLALIILAYCSDFNQSATYQDVVLSMCGRRMQQFCSFIVALYCYGTCLTFLVIIGDQFDRAFASIYGPTFCHIWYMNRNFTIVASSIVFILPLCFSRKIDFLKYASSLGVVTILYVVFLIVYKYFTIEHHNVKVRTSPHLSTDIFYVVPVICFGYQCHVSVIPIYSCLRKRTVGNFIKSSLVALFICVLMYTCAGTFGYLTFGQDVQSDILESYHAKDAVVMIGMIALAAKTYTTYPILLFCGRLAVEGLWIDFRKLDGVDIASGEHKRRILVVIVWFVTNIGLAVFVPNIGDIIQTLGSLAAVFIFVFPGMCLMQVAYRMDPDVATNKTKAFIVFGSIFILIGAFIFGLVLTQSIILDMNGKNNSKQLCT